ncbi:MAG: LLM class F420-dependent oxidoreductase [Anaerolineae bacterium]|nr:LLM class F420-dependent oxidoreductase [Anaerolineae bacterium]
MRIGLQVPNFTWPGGPAQIGSRLAEIARAADEAGFYSLWVMDHFFQIDVVGPPETDMLEGYSTLSYLAALTRNVKLGTLVTGVVYRYPGILVKTATTLDVLSGGRAYLGIGAAWFGREAAGLGTPFPEVSERFERLEETLQIAHQMWSGSTAPYQGKHYQLAETMCVPQPLSRPHPPIMIGGMGEKKTLRLVAQYADACNLFTGYGLEALSGRLDTLKRHCDALGRDYAAVEKTSLSTVHLAPGNQSASDVIAHCRELASIGIQHAIFNMPNIHDLTPLETFRQEIIPAAAAF